MLAIIAAIYRKPRMKFGQGEYAYHNHTAKIDLNPVCIREVADVSTALTVY